jgi:FlaG/FlaF family flagellin (archaellin)
MCRSSAILWITVWRGAASVDNNRMARSRQRGNPALPWSEMDEPNGSESTGMGPTPSGPSFVRWAPAPDDTPPIGLPPPGPSARSMAKPTSRLPTVISVAVIFLVAVVVAAASLVANFADTQVRAPVSKQPIPQVAAQGDRIEFTTSEGSGQLILLRHSWLSSGQVPPTSGSYLRVEVELTCTAGAVDYDPYNFQVFDETGQLFETAIEGAGDAMLESGTLYPGDRVRGTIAFDMPHSEATLLMSDDSNQTVTALKVPD